MSKIFEGQAGVITGASSGIGREIAQLLGKEGMELWLVGRSQAELDITASVIEESGGPEAHCVSMDLSEKGALANLVVEVGTEHPYLFTVINNAGVMYPEPMLDADPERWHDMFAVNVLTPMESCQAAVLQMRRHGKPGQLINISSTSSHEYNFGAYGATKVAVNHMGHSLRHELEGDDIRITTIIPGGFASNLMRSYTPETLDKLSNSFARSNFDPEGADARKFIADPVHLANMVKYVLQQPVELNIEEITIRPAVSMNME